MVHRYFYDCEFVEDGRVVDLVSIGVVDESGREFYAISTEWRYQWVTGDTGGTAAGFLSDKIDLSGGNLNFGFLIRF